MRKKPQRIRLSKAEKSVLEVMLNNATPVLAGGALICTLKENPEKPDETVYVRSVADSLRQKGCFIGEGNSYFPTTAAYKALGIKV